MADHGPGDGQADVIGIASHQAVAGQQGELAHADRQQRQRRAFFIAAEVAPSDFERAELHRFRGRYRFCSRLDRLNVDSGTSTFELDVEVDHLGLVTFLVLRDQRHVSGDALAVEDLDVGPQQRPGQAVLCGRRRTALSTESSRLRRVPVRNDSTARRCPA